MESGVLIKSKRHGWVLLSTSEELQPNQVLDFPDATIHIDKVLTKEQFLAAVEELGPVAMLQYMVSDCITDEECKFFYWGMECIKGETIQ